MPIDTRRIAGPEESQPLTKFIKELETPALIDENDRRRDGRRDSDVRPIFFKVGVVTQAKGSAYIEMEQTKVICSVYGPREIPRKQDFTINGVLFCDLKFSSFSCKTRRPPQPDAQDKELSLVLQQALEPVVCLHKFPKARVDVFCLILEDAGSALAAAITCAGAALADAGIEMYDLVIGCSGKQIGHNFFLDPSIEEEQQQPSSNEPSIGNVTIGVMPCKQQITAILQSGLLEHHTLVKDINTLMDGCHRIYPIIKHHLVQSVKKRQKELQTEDDKT